MVVNISSSSSEKSQEFKTLQCLEKTFWFYLWSIEVSSAIVSKKFIYVSLLKIREYNLKLSKSLKNMTPTEINEL